MLSIKFIVLCSNKWIDISVPCRGTTFLNGVVNYVEIRKYHVSVPCRGTTFLNKIARIISGIPQMPFPSPVGELHFSILIFVFIEFLLLWFPSPVGELHFSIVFVNPCVASLAISVPCRGTTFLNRIFVPISTKPLQDYFRPLSGNYISQLSDHVAFISTHRISVPCRGTTFLNNNGKI